MKEILKKKALKYTALGKILQLQKAEVEVLGALFLKYLETVNVEDLEPEFVNPFSFCKLEYSEEKGINYPKDISVIGCNEDSNKDLKIYEQIAKLSDILLTEDID